MEKDDHFIDGIYNYCDRWCERCTFTSRCRNYEMDEAVDNEALDIQNQKFWKGIGDHFESAISMLLTMAAEKGIDLDNIPEEETRAWKEKRKHVQQEAREHPLAKLTMQYVQEGRQLLKENKVLKDKGEDLIKQVELGIAGEKEALKQAKEMSEYLEVIRWYSSFIHVKFQRALQGKMEDDGWQKANGYQTDFDGSAKIAVIGCE